MMFIECLAIIAVIGIVILMTARSGRRTFALAILPLLTVPVSYLISAPLSSVLEALLPIRRAPLAIGITLVGLVVSCVLFGMLAGNFHARRSRRAYLFMCGGFSVLLTAVLVTNVVAVLI